MIFSAAEDMKDNELTHAEIWEDSELLESWDEALEEYKKYHGIAAKGENIDHLIKEYQEAQKQTSAEQEHHAEDEGDGQCDDDEGEEEYDPRVDQTAATAPAPTAPTPGEHLHDAHTQGNHSEPNPKRDKLPETQQVKSSLPGMPGGPPNVAEKLFDNSVSDENVRNLMMSWYYAGYYTGFFEGQQSAAGNQNAANTG